MPKRRAFAAFAVLLTIRITVSAISCPDQGGSCPTNPGYCVPSYHQTSPDSCADNCGHFGDGKLTKTAFWQIVFTGGHVDGPFANVGYGAAPPFKFGPCTEPRCWPTFYCPTTDCAFWEQIVQDNVIHDTGSGLTCNPLAGTIRRYVHIDISSSCNCPGGGGDDGGGGGGGGGGWEGCQPCFSDFDCEFCGDAWCNRTLSECEGYTPILIDINGDGYRMTAAADGVVFDFKGDGSRRSLSWTAGGSDDAWLVLDRNGNGVIDGGAELFGSSTPQPHTEAGRNGFTALTEYDKPSNGGNSDGVIDRLDAIFTSLLLWQDTNHTGTSEPSELHTLAALGLVSIDLDHKESRRVDRHGNKFKYRSKVRDTKGAHLGRWAWDVFLLVQR